MARSRDPLAAIVTFAMTQPIDVVKAQLMTLNTIVKTREANEKPQPGQVVVRQRPRTRAPQQPATPKPPAAAMTSAATSTAPTTHDPTLRTAGGTPRRRRGRPPSANKPTGAMPPLGQGTTAATPAPVAQSSAARPVVSTEDALPVGSEFPPQ